MTSLQRIMAVIRVYIRGNKHEIVIIQKAWRRRKLMKKKLLEGELVQLIFSSRGPIGVCVKLFLDTQLRFMF